MNKNKKQIKRFKLTPEVNKQILVLLETLPQLQKVGKDGIPLFRATSKLVAGVDVPQEQRDKINGFDSSKSYISKGKEPVGVNHKVNLIDLYETKGWPAVEAYVAQAHAVAEKGKKKEVENV